MPPYPFAAIMLLSWPVITAIIFMRMERVTAFLVSLIAGYMFLPPNITIDFPVIPAIDKSHIASMSSLLMLSLGMGRASIERDPMADEPQPRMPIAVKLLIGLLAVGTAVTVISNSEPLVEGITYRPGMVTSDIFAGLILMSIELIPFFVAFRLLSTPYQSRKLLKIMMIALIIYSIPMLFEVRMSPQLNTWIYGYFPHSFLQAIRYGGYRPIVFMDHPIWVASFATMGFIATLSLAKVNQGGLRMIVLLAYLAVVLILCKTMTAILMSLLAIPLIMFATPSMIIRISALIAIAVICYPLLRLMDLIPTDSIVQSLMEWQPERAMSLQFRFENEFVLLERAMLKPISGWGGWGRNFPMNGQTGELGAVADGEWVIVLGTAGIMGYLALFGILIAPILILWRRRPALKQRYDDADALVIATLSLIVSLNLIELIPNATLTPLTWLLNGAVLGHASRLRYTRDPRHRWKQGSDAVADGTRLRPALL